MIITKTINADLLVRELPQQIHAVQGDTATRKIAVKLFANREPWTPGEGVSFALRYRKPDGTGGTYDTMPDGEKAWEQMGNTISFLLAPQMLAVPGRVEAQLEIFSGNSVIASFGFCILVEENVAANATRSHNYFNWAQRLETKLKEKLKEIKESGVFDGAVGATPDLQIGIVTTLPAGSAATAAFRGTAEMPVLDLGLPKGADAQVDTTLTLSGRAADAAAVGTALKGKAPAGYGFGENLLVEGRSVLAVWGETFEAFCGKIDAILATMGDYTGRLIIARGGLWYGDFYQNCGNCQAVLYRGAGEANASLVTVGVRYDWKINKINGAWQLPEWVNPPLVLGMEYRTTERYQGKTVYVACFSCGNLPASGTTETIWNPPDGGIAHIISHDVTYGDNQGSVNGSGYKTYSHNFNEIRIDNEGSGNLSAFTATALIKYWKE